MNSLSHRQTRFLRVACLLLAVLTILSLVGCGSQANTASKGEPVKNEILSVTLKPSPEGHTKDTVAVKTTLTDALREDTVRADRICLFELPSGMDTIASVAGLEPLATAKVNKKPEFTFSLYDGVRTRLYSRFVLALYRAESDSYTVVTAPRGISNPEAYAAKDALTFTAQPSKKGLQVSDHITPLDAQALTPSHVLVEVPLEDLLLGQWKEDAVSYVHNGTSRFVRKEALDRLDEQVKSYSDAGATVYLRFALGAPTCDMGELPANLYMIQPEDNGKEYAVNMTNVAIAQQMEGFFAFMAERYTDPAADYGVATRFIIGSGVNQSDNRYAHNLNADTFVPNYERLVRVADTALRSRCPDGRVYISLDSNWNKSQRGNNWKAQALLSVFASEAATQGDYPWQVACELYAESDGVWSSDGTIDETSTRLTVNNLSALTEVLETSRYLYGGTEARHVVLTDLKIPYEGTPVSQERQASSYAYAYCKAVENNLCDAIFYDESLLGATDLLIAQAFDIMDTTQNQAAVDLAGGIVGSSFAKLYQSISADVQAVSKVSGDVTSKATVTPPRSAGMLCEFNDLSGSCGFESAGRAGYMALHTDETLGHSLLYTTFARQSLHEHMGIVTYVNATELMGVKEISAPLYAGSAQVPASVTLRLVRLSGDAADGTVIYESTCDNVSAQSWQTLTFSVSSFTSRLEKNDRVALVLLVDTPNQLSSEMGLGGIYVNPRASQSSAPTVVVTIIVIAVIAGLAVLVVYLWKRKRNNDGE